tara:strand:+ start:4464 stop:5987 length:1524 start_codon:yes stop_codon:yes gene_type:complete
MTQEMDTIEPVRGASDLSPSDWAELESIRSKIALVFQQYGYQAIDVPVLERTELFQRNAGTGITAQTYSFTDRGGTDVCLRPEFTASIARFYTVNSKSSLPTPARLYYSGPAFRYEEPTHATYRQYTESGAELIGCAGYTADAEILQLACSCMTELGFQDYQVVVGHLGILSEFFRDLGLSRRVESLLRESLEDLRQPSDSISDLRAAISTCRGSVDNPSMGITQQVLQTLNQNTEKVTDEAIKAAVASTLDRLEIDYGSGRPRAAIEQRLIERLTRGDESLLLEKAYAFLQELFAAAGTPPASITKALSIIKQFGLSTSSIDEVESIFDTLNQAGIDLSKFTFNPAMGRGLQYYTGFVFEVFSTDETSNRLQLCGGGRYDDLIEKVSGSSSTPAAGLTFGLERLRIKLTGLLDTSRINTPDVLLVNKGASTKYLMEIANSLRASGIRVVNPLNQPPPSSDCIPVLISVSSKEESEQTSLVQLTNSKPPDTVPLDQLSSLISALLGG